MSLWVGTARVDVDVPVGTEMAGYAARSGPSAGVHDPLTVRALVLDDVALVTVDVCGLHERTIAMVREQLGDEVRESIVTATHTHSGPCVAFERLGPHDAAVHDAVVAAVVAAVRGAVASRAACTVRYGVTPAAGLATNRRHADRLTDPPAQLLRFESEGRTAAWLVVFPAHPVVLDATNRVISGDFPSYVRDRLEAASPGALCVYATGAAGDQNCGQQVDLSYDVDTSEERTFEVAERVGAALAEAVLAAPASEVAAAPAAVAVEPVELPIDRVSAARARAEAAQWRAELDAGVSPQRERLLQAWLRWSAELLAGSYDQVPDTWAGTVTALTLGEVALVALPGEPFLATAARIAAAEPAHPVLVLGYANGCPGYLPPADEYPHGGYEVADAHRYYGMPGPFAEGGAERLETAALTALRSLRTEGPGTASSTVRENHTDS